jgi:hypothetical protein
MSADVSKGRELAEPAPASDAGLLLLLPLCEVLVMADMLWGCGTGSCSDCEDSSNCGAATAARLRCRGSVQRALPRWAWLCGE